MINKTIKALMTLIAISSLSSFAYAGSFGIGLTGGIASVSADGTETNGDTAGTETEASVQSATAGNSFAIGSVFAEYNFGDSERFTLGVDYIPGTAKVNSKTLSRTDTNTAGDSGTLKANAEISDHYTIYGELILAAGVYAKYGFTQVDIDVKQTNSTGYGTYPDKTLDAHTFGLGYKGSFGTNGFFKVEGYYTDYDSYSGTSSSTNAHTVKADLDVTGAKLALGYKF